jgi:hypothetical protein
MHFQEGPRLCNTDNDLLPTYNLFFVFKSILVPSQRCETDDQQSSFSVLNCSAAYPE